MSMRDRFTAWRNPHRLYRDGERGKLAGVCAGIADYFGLDPLPIRIGAAVGLVFFFVPTIIGYIALAALLPKKPPALYANREEEVFWRGVATAPNQTLQGLRHKFADLEGRLARMETAITASEFELHRKFRDLGG